MFNHSNIKSNLKEDYRFLKGWIKNPSAVGSIKPTSKTTAKHMASLLPIKSGLPVLELGPGTGVITREILDRGLAPEKLISVEYDPEFAANLQKEFPDVNVLHGDAFNPRSFMAEAPFDHFCGVMGAIPLLNFPMEKRQELIDMYLDYVMDDGVFIQMSYGLKPPIQSVSGKFTVEKSDRIFKNLPPVGIWIYKRDK